VEVAGTEKGAAYASLLRGLLDRGLKGGASSGERRPLGDKRGCLWVASRCGVAGVRHPLRAQRFSARAGHFDSRRLAEDLKAILKMRRQETALAPADEFVELHRKSAPKAVSVF